jgi:hypothetical protein
MFIDSNGKYHAETADELIQLFQMATQGGGRDPSLSRDNGMSALEIIGALGTSFPGSTDLFGMNPVDVDLDVNNSTRRTAGSGRPALGITPDGPARTPMGYGTSGVQSKAAGIRSRISDFRKGYEAGVQPLVQNQTRALQNLIPQGPLQAKGGMGMRAGRMAGVALKNPLLQKGLAYAPAIGTALAVGDVVLGDESIGNKAMDATAMTIGGVLGSAVPIVGTGLGIAAGKMVSDGSQWLFGDKKTPEQRKMELALAQLQGRGLI